MEAMASVMDGRRMARQRSKARTAGDAERSRLVAAAGVKVPTRARSKSIVPAAATRMLDLRAQFSEARLAFRRTCFAPHRLRTGFAPHRG